MAKSDEKAARVEYRVLAPVYVNGSICDPAAANPLGGERRQDNKVYVMAPPGLEGTALERTDGTKKPEPQKPG
jgi:hypothetical protein